MVKIIEPIARECLEDDAKIIVREEEELRRINETEIKIMETLSWSREIHCTEIKQLRKDFDRSL